MTVTDAEIHGIVENYAKYTDAPQDIEVVARWCADAMEATGETGGCAAIEIGVRCGGTSAIMCALADAMGLKEFLVISVDPYGMMPFYTPELTDKVYGESDYTEAKTVLAGFARSAFFRMTAGDFIASVLPTYRWWVRGTQHPSSRRFLSFAFVDGQHEDTNVVQEVAGLVPFIAPGGVVAIDNTNVVERAVALLKDSPRLGLTKQVHWVSPIDKHQRDAFTVP